MGTSAAPSNKPPASSDHFSKIGSFGLYGNDTYEDCGPTAVANSRRLTTLYLTGQEEIPSQQDVFALYGLCNPGFDPATHAQDNGVILQDMLGHAHKQGIGGVKAVAFGRLDHTNPEELQWAVALFGSVIWGVQLDVAQQGQNGVWRYIPKSEVWGGHATLNGTYRGQSRWGQATWGQKVEATELFVERQLEEAWAVIWPEHLASAGFMSGIHGNALAADYHQLTGRTLSFGHHKHPRPVPAPGPQPLPPGEGIANTGPELAVGALQAAATILAPYGEGLRNPDSVTALASRFMSWLVFTAGSQSSDRLAGILTRISRKEDALMSQNDEVLADVQKIEDNVTRIRGGVSVVTNLIQELQGQVGQPLTQDTLDQLSRAASDVSGAADQLANVGQPVAPSTPDQPAQ
jgi:hypothetical protein